MNGNRKKMQINEIALRHLRKEGVQTWHGHLAREKRTISREMPQGITGKMPVPRYFASASALLLVCHPSSFHIFHSSFIIHHSSFDLS